MKFFKSKWFKLACLLLLPLLVIFMVELISRQSIAEVWSFIKFKHISFQTTYAIVLLVILFFIGLLPRVSWGIICSLILFLLFGTINHLKYLILGENFYPWDLVFAGNTIELFNFINIKLTIKWIIPFIIFIGFLCLICFIYKEDKLKRLTRVVIVLVSFEALYFLCISNNWYKNFTLSKCNFDANIYIPADFYNKYGSIYAFAVNLSEIGLEIPKGYSIEYAKKLEEENINIAENSEDIKPNVIIILSEAFSIPSRTFKNVTYSVNPTECFERIEKESIHGRAITPAFGGGTSNVELEVMSGFSNAFLRRGINAYTQYINNPIETIPSLLKKQGYSTLAVHTYNKQFFRRHLVYPFLGIDDYTALEDIENPTISGYYVADNQFVDTLIKKYENNKALSANPVFMLGVSMENHAPYREDKYRSYTVNVYSDLLDEDEIGILQSYVQGVYNADKSIGKLVDYFKSQKEPTIILAFGDHLPALDSGFNIYQKLKIVDTNKTEDWTLEQKRDMYSIPYFIWANYGLEEQELSNIGTNYLGNQLLNVIKFNKTPYFNYLDKLQNKVKAYKQNFVIDENYEMVDKLPEHYEKLINDQSILQYYYMFDKYKNN